MNTIQTGKYNILIGQNAIGGFDSFLAGNHYSSLLILVDENSKKHCLPALKRSFTSSQALTIIQIPSGEKNKNIRTCEKIWKELSGINTDRRSLLINLGGGVISDLGGFCASTYKRGIDFVNIPTTLLAQVDASVGGKTGIDFLNHKNQIGTFDFPKAVFIDPAFLRSLNKRELISGFAEVIKHGLIADENYWNTIKEFNPFKNKNWEEIILRSVYIKNEIVSKDPYESGLRKTLNFGHTIGHAIESASLRSKKKMLHGEAIALGMVCEAYLSRKCCGLSSEDLDTISRFIISIFKPTSVKFPIKKLIGLMKQDKKNKESEINFTLLSAIGKAKINNTCSEDLIEEALHFFNSLCK